MKMKKMPIFQTNYLKDQITILKNKEKIVTKIINIEK